MIHADPAELAAIFEATVDAVITIDERGTIERFNPAAERIFGYARDEVAGHNISMLMPEPYRSEHDGYLEAYHATGRRRIIGIGREVEGRRKDGSTFPMDLAVSEVRLADGRRVYVGLVRDISERRVLEHEVLRVAEEERRSLGQDLHDGLGQMLTGTGLIARGLARQLSNDGSPRAPDADELVELLAEADAYARSLARGLVPVELEAHGLADALDRLATQARRLFGVGCHVEADPGAAVADGTAASHLFRIAQEAVSNAVRHGRARSIAIRLGDHDGALRLTIADDGVGFGRAFRADDPAGLDPDGQEVPPEVPAPVRSGPDRRGDDRGMGVRIMHYRARVVGGTLVIGPGADGGTVVTCTLPVRPPAPASP